MIEGYWWMGKNKTQDTYLLMTLEVSISSSAYLSIWPWASVLNILSKAKIMVSWNDVTNNQNNQRGILVWRALRQV